MPLRNRCATLFAFALSLAAAGAGAQEPSFQGNDLFGRPMYTHGSNPVNVGGTDQLQRAREEARRAWEADPSIDNATWYGRVLAYQGLHREAIEVFTAGLKRHPQSGKLLRHRAHRYVNLREFDKSIADGLRAAELYRGKPLERERLGPDYFPSTPDVVQFYLYYHLGHAYFAKKDFPAAAQWFSRSREVALGVEDLPIHAAAVYWQYLSLARDLRFGEALGQHVVDHRRRQQPVFAADGQPDRVADAMRQRFTVTAERRDEAARKQFLRADRLERMLCEQLIEGGEIKRGGKAEQREVSEEH